MGLEHGYGRIMEHGHIASRQQQSQFGRTELAMRKMELPDGVSSQITFDGEHQERNKKPDRDGWVDKARKRQSSQEKQGGDAIRDVVHVKPVTRALRVAYSRQGSVQTIAEPIQGEENNAS
jgi:hypothetical protein